ncbi:MAG: hypothetical protein R2909_09035 [Gemmatimonadales bacterium]
MSRNLTPGQSGSPGLGRGGSPGGPPGGALLGLTTAASAQTSGKLRVAGKVVRAESGGEVAAQVRRAARDSTGSSRVSVGVARVATVPERAAPRRVVVVSFLRN